jgi:hypothetical protein
MPVDEAQSIICRYSTIFKSLEIGTHFNGSVDLYLVRYHTVPGMSGSGIRIPMVRHTTGTATARPKASLAKLGFLGQVEGINRFSITRRYRYICTIYNHFKSEPISTEASTWLDQDTHYTSRTRTYRYSTTPR